MTNVHDAVRETYGKIARSEQQGCCAPRWVGGHPRVYEWLWNHRAGGVRLE